MPRTSPDAAARTPVSFDKVRGRQPPPRTIAPEGDPTIIPGITPDARRRFRLGKMTGGGAGIQRN